MEARDPHGGPDYVDEWMKRNLDPGVVEFVRRCCTSFVRWDLLRQLHGRSSEATLAELVQSVGASRLAVLRELESLAAMGLLNRQRRGGRTTFRLEPSAPLASALEAVIGAYDDDQELRFALVYSIVRASHRAPRRTR